MKFRFKVQGYQSDAVQAVVDCFEGQPPQTGLRYRIDPGMVKAGQTPRLEMDEGFRNADLVLPPENVLKNIQRVQGHQNLPISAELKRTSVADVNLDIEMETGTGKTYCYIKTIFELNQHYGWNKFIIVVPSIAIREGVAQSLSDTADHFLEQYGKRVRWFIYNSKELHELESFSSDAGINVMVINVQAFNARGKDARRIYEELDDFRSRRPIDVIKKNHPILILDEPQKMEGARTVEAMKEFNPLFILRYSATHRQEHNRVYRLDALDAYNQKLVKKIAVRGITVKGQAGASAYLYLQNIVVSRGKPPVARVEMEIRHNSEIKKEIRVLGKGDNLYDKSEKLDQYKNYVVSDINANDNTVSFTNGVTLEAGDAQGDVNEGVLRRLQIREAIAAHFEKEKQLFDRGIKVLSLFFIDHVAKYRQYEGSIEKAGEYAEIFEDEYKRHLNEVLTLEDTPYNRYLKSIDTGRTHEGYFSIDKNKRLVDPTTGARSTESDDVDAYDLILKRKAQLLSFNEPVRFIFAHSALREGWDNPNVFVIGMLKHSDSTVSRRQEVGRGLRISVNQNGDRVDDPATVHDVNVLTVVASEGYKEFVAGLQTEIVKELSARPRKADEAYFTGKILRSAAGDVQVTPQMAKLLTRYLIKNDYTDTDDKITPTYHESKKAETLAPLPAELAPYATQVFQLVDTVFSESAALTIADGRKGRDYRLNDNFAKKEFRELWKRIHQKAVYAVDFDSNELVEKCVVALDQELKVAPLQYVVQRGEQTNGTTYEALQNGAAFEVQQTQTSQLNASVHSSIPYDLIGKISGETRLTRATVGAILTRIKPSVFAKYQANPEDFLRNASRLINEQKAAVIVEHLTYNEIDERYDVDIFTREQGQKDLSSALKVNRHIYDYVFTDSKNERDFVELLDTGTEVEVYAKLPRSFTIPTPVGNYAPDWAIAFKKGSVKHIYFIAETKGAMTSVELREVEKSKIKCARKFFHKITSDKVKYEMVDGFETLMKLVQA